MTIKQDEIIDFFERMEALEADKKAISTEMSESYAAFAENFDVNKKAVQKAFKEWKEWKKNEAEYTEVDWSSDQLLVVAIPTLSTQGA